MVVIRPRKHPATFGILVNLYTFGYKWHKQKKDVMYCLHYVFRSCGGRTRTCDLQVMSLASYQLLHSAILIICAFLDCVCKGMKFSGNCKTFQRKSLVFGVILTCINGIMPYLLIRIGIWDVLMCAVKGLPQYDSVTVQNVWHERDGCGGEIAAEWLIWVRNIWTFRFGRLLSIGR